MNNRMIIGDGLSRWTVCYQSMCICIKTLYRYGT